MENNFFVEGQLVDVYREDIYPAKIRIQNGRIKEISRLTSSAPHYILPGLIDAHVHIESSMLTPGNFAAMAVSKGTVAVLSDPHEIANVLGIKGIDFMIDDSRKVPFNFFFGAPSCVPATVFEESGSKIGADEIEYLMERNDIYFLSEMMNFPGVLMGDHEIEKKISIAKRFGKRIDGHAPELTGNELKKYAGSGITTDHECASMKEAEEKIRNGMKILIREGSAARNFDELMPLIDLETHNVMLCTDDIHPDDLEKGHIDRLIRKGMNNGLSIFNLLRASSLNPKRHYNLDIGMLQINDHADFIVAKDLDSLQVITTFIRGIPVYDDGKVLFNYTCETRPNRFVKNFIKPDDLQVHADGNKINVIVARDGDLRTGREWITPVISNGFVTTDANRDILKIVVLNRYRKARPNVGFIHGFGLKKGAFASSIAHDSHNIIGVGANDDDLCAAINIISEHKGGISVVDDNKTDILPLPVGGILSDKEGNTVAGKYKKLTGQVKQLGSRLLAPFMTLSFMALLVIPDLKIGDRYLFDVKRFKPIGLFERM
ncbi:MAG: adenine deaminase [Bacteroidales bacterium]|nr:MAG: adenine deaminase [Bacteroidales bacterium]